MLGEGRLEARTPGSCMWLCRSPAALGSGFPHGPWCVTACWTAIAGGCWPSPGSWWTPGSFVASLPGLWWPSPKPWAGSHTSGCAAPLTGPALSPSHPRGELLFAEPGLCPHAEDRHRERSLPAGRHGPHQRAGGSWCGALTFRALRCGLHHHPQDVAGMPGRHDFLPQRFGGRCLWSG